MMTMRSNRCGSCLRTASATATINAPTRTRVPPIAVATINTTPAITLPPFGASCLHSTNTFRTTTLARRSLSTMSAQHGHSEACCNIPPIVSKGYDAKGTYDEVGGFKTYVTGPPSATKGVVTIYDIFGYYPQTLQGADIMATSDDTKYRVLMPDWFKGEPCPLSIFPPDTEEKQKKLGAFFEKNPPNGLVSLLPDYVKAASAKYPDIKEWAVLGFCWGGKAVSLMTSSSENPFKVGIQAHPAMLDPSDASKIKVPSAVLASKDESADDVKKFEANLSVAKHVETYGDQIHGWMAARADLEDERVKSEYKRGYETVLKFLSQHL
ncbi:hypothetical protein F5Y16DRAFT_333265 [Xylariaceae sp. FL0255]|nr:hypothetical protein F5Y16DRAFT_333265 [Xylariaceae sp. FL0255]